MLRLRRIAEPDPASLVVRDGLTTYEVELRRRPAARRLTLRVSGSSGAIALTLPPKAPLAMAQSFLDAHSGWIAARVARLPERLPFTPDAAIPLRGVPHRIVHRPGIRKAAYATRDEAGEPILVVAGDLDAVPGRVRRFLAAEAQADLAICVARHTATLGRPAARVTIRDTRSRWGSCSSTGALSFSWRLILAPPLVLDYLAAHECAHLKELNHSHRFWRIVHDLCPATDEAERWLKRNGSGLHRYG